MKTTQPNSLRRLTIATVLLTLTLAAPGVGRGDDLWDIYQIALEHDATYRAASHEYEGAKLRLPLAKAALNPSLALTGSAGWARSDSTGSSVTDDESQLDLKATLPLYDPTLRREVDQAEFEVERARVQFEQSRNELILRVADRYFQLLAARANADVARRQKVAIQRQLDLASERLNVGLGTRTDLYDAEARLQQAVADEIQANNAIDNAVQALKQVIGTTPEALTPLDKDAPLQPPVPNSAEVWVERALTHNLALRAADFDLQIADAEIEKQNAARWPTIGLSANQRRRNSTDGVVNSTTFGATLNWPLRLDKAIQHKTKQAALQYNAAEQSREALKRQVEADTISAYLAVVSGISQVTALSEAVRAGDNAVQAKDEGFRAGLTTNLDVLDAQRDLARSRTDYLSARYAFILSVLRLEQAVGDLDEGDVERVNGWLVEK